jgi:hypothetical protein
MKCRGVLILTLCAVITGSASAGSLYVDAAAAGGTGSSWATAKKNLQNAINAASSGDTIYIATGFYTPAPAGGDTGISFVLKNGVNLEGGYPLHSGVTGYNKFGFTTLSGDLNGNDIGIDLSGNIYGLRDAANKTDNSRCVVNANDVTVQLKRICIAYGYNTTANGGGLCMNENSNITMDTCLVAQNYSSSWGGGIWSHGGTGPNHPHLTLINTDFMNNSAQKDGGAVFMEVSSYPIMRGCEFIGNNSWSYCGGGVYFSGACVAEVTDCYFNHNFAVNGAGLYVLTNSASNMNLADNICNISQCVFDANWVKSSCPHLYAEDDPLPSAEDPSGWDSTESLIVNVSNCLFENGLSIDKCNGAVGVASTSIYPEHHAMTANFTNCTFANQKGFEESAVGMSLTGIGLGYWNPDSWVYVNVKNCILWTDGVEIGPKPEDLPGGQWGTGGAIITTRYSCIEPDPKNFLGTETNNIAGDPQFVIGNIYGEIYNVQATSPTIDAGDPADDWSKEPKCNGERINMGWTGGADRATPKVTIANVLDGDVNCDGNVDLADFSALAGEWLQ